MRPQAAAMKALLDQPGLQVMPGCGDGMGARLIEEAGFPSAFISGSSVSAMRLAMPDQDLVTALPRWPTRSKLALPPRQRCCGWPMATRATATRWPCKR